MGLPGERGPVGALSPGRGGGPGVRAALLPRAEDIPARSSVPESGDRGGRVNPLPPLSPDSGTERRVEHEEPRAERSGGEVPPPPTGWGSLSLDRLDEALYPPPPLRGGPEESPSQKVLPRYARECA